MTRFVFHIGALDAGTRLLQDYLRDHKGFLLDHDISVIDPRDMDHYVLQGRQLMTRPELLLARLDDEFQAHPGATILGSDDETLGVPLSGGNRGLYPFAGPRVQALAAIAEEFDTTVVLYVMTQAEMIEASYLNAVRNGAHQPFRKWFSRIDTQRLSWSPVIESLRSALGDDKVIVADHGEIADGHNQFIERFLRRASPEFAAQVDFTPVRDRRLSRLGLRLALTANRHLSTDDERSRMHQFLIREYSNSSGRSLDLLTDDERSQLTERYESDLRDL